MGQRHQIYVRTGGENSVIFGLHHQWLWGYTAIRLLSNVIRFVNNDKNVSYSPFYVKYKFEDQGKAVIKSCYSCDSERGYSHNVCELSKEECLNPLNGDNNNGITIIDFKGWTDKKASVKYCFMALDNSLECIDDGQEDKYIPLEPIEVEKYLTLHYPTLLSNRTYKGNDGKIKKWDKKDFEDIKKDIAVIKTAKLLTLKEVKDIFPVMYPKKKRA